MTRPRTLSSLTLRPSLSLSISRHSLFRAVHRRRPCAHVVCHSRLFDYELKHKFQSTGQRHLRASSSGIYAYGVSRNRRMYVAAQLIERKIDFLLVTKDQHLS